MSRFAWRGWLAAAAIFALGVAVGGAGTAWIGIRNFRQMLRSPAEARGLADRAAARIGADLERSLQLTPEQSGRVRSILADSAANLKAIRARAIAEAAADMRTSTDRIAAELPPEKHDELYRVVGRRFERLGLPPPTPVRDR